MTAVRVGLAMSLLVAFTDPAGAANVVASVQQVGGVYHVRGSFSTAAPIATVWQVLTDYERIGAFVRSVRSSAFIETPGGRRLLRQDAIAGLFPFRRRIRVELSLREEPRRHLAFRDELGRDFSRYTGAWTLRAVRAGTEVSYELEAEPRSGVPALVGRGVMARSTRDLLTQVRAEILRRAGAVDAVADSVANASPSRHS